MANKNRAALIAKTLKVVRKHFKPATPAKDRSLLQHLVYACCLENSLFEDADRAFQSLSGDYFDWNEVRVSTIRELSETLKPLNDPVESATRVKRILQSVFETHYSFDVEPLKKQNIGVAVKTIEKYNGSTPFLVAYATQHALGGHAIPVNVGLLESLRVVGVVSDGEAAKGAVPGLERAVPKNKGSEVASLLHQLGVEMHRSPLGPTIRKLLLEIEPACKDNLPKRATKAPEPPPAPPAKPAGKTAQAAKQALTGKPAPAAKAPPAKEETKKAATKKPTAPPPPVKVKSTKKPAAPPTKKPRPAAAKSTTKKPASPGKKITKKKPK